MTRSAFSSCVGTTHPRAIARCWSSLDGVYWVCRYEPFRSHAFHPHPHPARPAPAATATTTTTTTTITTTFTTTVKIKSKSKAQEQEQEQELDNSSSPRGSDLGLFWIQYRSGIIRPGVWFRLSLDIVRLGVSFLQVGVYGDVIGFGIRVQRFGPPGIGGKGSLITAKGFRDVR